MLCYKLTPEAQKRYDSMTAEQQARYDALCYKHYQEKVVLQGKEFEEWAELDRIVWPATGVVQDLTRDYTLDEVYNFFD